MDSEVKMIKVNPLIEALEMEIEALHEGDLVEAALVILRIVDKDGKVVVGLADSKISWVDQIGLIAAAHDIIRQPPIFRDPRDDRD
jgi:hypothetical protein